MSSFLKTMLLLFILIISTAALAQTTERVLINLQYGSNPAYDFDNNGIESDTGAIDFTVENSLFELGLNESNLCTRWNVQSENTGDSTFACYGSEACCNFMSMVPTRPDWNEPLYLSYGTYGATENNRVLAQTVYVEYSLGENPYTNTYYSEWKNLSAQFQGSFGGSGFSIMSSGNPIITITSPDNSSNLSSGENIYLNFSANETIDANYTLDAGEKIALGENTSFLSLLNGSLPHGVLANGQHTIGINYSGGRLEHTFTVADSAAPSISLNITNNSEQSEITFSLPVKITLSEYGNISYNANNNGFTAFEDAGTGRKKEIALPVMEGKNNLTIKARDFNGNERQEFYKFNFTEIGSCSDARQNGQETGIDCGGSCSSCVPFNASTGQLQYNLTDSVYATVIARVNSTVNMTVRKNNAVTYRHLFQPLFSGFPISEIRKIENTSNAGNYTITADMHYINVTETITRQFEVLAPQSNPLSVTINANRTSIDEGKAVTFSATVSGNTGTVTYKWDFENDGTIDSTESNPTKLFQFNGTYDVNLTVKDSFWNQTDIETISVRKMFNFTVTVRQNGTGTAIQNAIVSVDDEEKNTSSSGQASFTVYKGSHDIEIAKRGYNKLSKDISINANNQEVSFNLTLKDEKAPIVYLISPQNDTIISSRNVTFTYAAADGGYMTCRLYYEPYSLPFSSVKASNSSVLTGSSNNFKVANMPNGDYRWKVDCIDRSGNLNASQTYSLVVNEEAVINELSVDLDQSDRDTESLVQQIRSAIEDSGSLTGKEKEAADAIRLKEMLERSITSLDRANRDLHSLKWRKLNESELEKETQKILDRVEEIRKTTPRVIEVAESTEFVNYPGRPEIAEGVSVLLNQTNLKFSRREKEQLISHNLNLQSAITVTTKAKIVNFEYISGDRRTYTLIHKIVKVNSNISDYVFYEVIPKEIAKDLNETELLFDHEVVQYDPIVRIDLNKIEEYSYLIKKSISLDDSESIKSMLLDKSLKIESKGIFIGLSILESAATSFINAADIRLILEIAAIVLLAGFYFVYSMGGIEKFAHLLGGKELKELKKIIEEANADAAAMNYENASLKYRQITEKFRALEKEKRERVKQAVTDMAHRLNMLYVHKLADEAESSIMANDKKASFAIYKKIQSLYSIIPREHKAEVSKKCMELHSKISNISNLH